MIMMNQRETKVSLLIHLVEVSGHDYCICFWPWCVHCALAVCSVSFLDVESKTLQGVKGELDLDTSGQFHLENTTLDYQKLSDKEILRITGPLGADFTVKVSS